MAVQFLLNTSKNALLACGPNSGGRVQRIRDFDLVVAAAALHHDLTVLTNDAHFGRVPGIKLYQASDS
jgi:predicted nucleic acid-binding protein